MKSAEIYSAEHDSVPQGRVPKNTAFCPQKWDRGWGEGGPKSQRKQIRMALYSGGWLVGWLFVRLYAEISRIQCVANVIFL